MSIFNLRGGVINDYHRYVESFLNIHDERINRFVNKECIKRNEIKINGK